VSEGGREGVGECEVVGVSVSASEYRGSEGVGE
jgi:hypothetical protein